LESKISDYYPLIEMSPDFIFSMIEKWDNYGTPVIKTGGHLRREPVGDLDSVWGNEVYIEERTVDVHIKRLRAALAPFACDHYVETVRGSGYRITKNPVNT
jgi:hypothetical protein